MRKSIMDSCIYALTSKGELEIENISEYENLRKKHGQPANNNFGGSPAYDDAAYLAETPTPNSMSPAPNSALPSQKPGSPSPGPPTYSPTSPAYAPTSPAYTPM